MTVYEKCRVCLHFAQVFATILIPIIAVRYSEKLKLRRRKQYEDKKNIFKYQNIIKKR
jgi:hypothetical protein